MICIIISTKKKNLSYFCYNSADNSFISKVVLFPGATDSVTKYFLQSEAAEARANASTINAGSTVETSAALRQVTEEKLNQTREEFLQRHSEHAQRLDNLAGEMETLDLSEISEKVGGYNQILKSDLYSCVF